MSAWNENSSTCVPALSCALEQGAIHFCSEGNSAFPISHQYALARFNSTRSVIYIVLLLVLRHCQQNTRFRIDCDDVQAVMNWIVCGIRSRGLTLIVQSFNEGNEQNHEDTQSRSLASEFEAVTFCVRRRIVNRQSASLSYLRSGLRIDCLAYGPFLPVGPHKRYCIYGWGN